jgi:hypothetical protein
MGHIQVTGYSRADAEVVSDFEANECDAYFREIFVFTYVLYGTYIATPEAHSDG